MAAILSSNQTRVERQKRRAERREARQKAVEITAEEAKQKKRKSLPGFLGKYRKEICEWLRHYMLLMMKADDAGVPCIKEMTREQRNKFVQEYVDVSEFRTQLESYLDAEEDSKHEV